MKYLYSNKRNVFEILQSRGLVIAIKNPKLQIDGTSTEDIVALVYHIFI